MGTSSVTSDGVGASGSPDVVVSAMVDDVSVVAVVVTGGGSELGVKVGRCGRSGVTCVGCGAVGSWLRVTGGGASVVVGGGGASSVLVVAASEVDTVVGKGTGGATWARGAADEAASATRAQPASSTSATSTHRQVSGGRGGGGACRRPTRGVYVVLRRGTQGSSAGADALHGAARPAMVLPDVVRSLL